MQQAFKVELREFVNPAGTTYFISAIRGKVIELPLGFGPRNPTFCFEFEDSTGRKRDEFNATRRDFVDAAKLLVAQQHPELNEAALQEQAEAQASVLISGLLSEDAATYYEAAAALASAYGYEALPLNEQDV